MQSIRAVAGRAAIVWILVATPVFPGEASGLEAESRSGKFSQILDQNLDEESRVQAAEELFLTRDPIIIEELSDAMTSIDLSQDPIGLTVASKVILKYWEFRVRSAGSRKEEVILLLEALEVNGDRRFGRVRPWAAFELCDLGLSFAWTSIESEIGGKSNWSQEQLAICRRKIQLVEDCDGDHIKAWETALKTEDTFPSRPIHSWAHRSLKRSSSREAGKILLRFYVPQLPGSLWTLTFIVRDLRKKGWTDEELLEFGWTGRPFGSP